MHDIDSVLRADLASALAAIVEGADDHFYGSWRGGAKTEGGHGGAPAMPTRLAEPPEWTKAPAKGSRVTVTDLRDGSTHKGVVAGYDAKADALVMHSEFGKGEKVLPRKSLRFDAVEAPPGMPHAAGTIHVPPRLPPQYGGAIPMVNPPQLDRKERKALMTAAANKGIRSEFDAPKRRTPLNRYTDRELGMMARRQARGAA